MYSIQISSSWKGIAISGYTDIQTIICMGLLARISIIQSRFEFNAAILQGDSIKKRKLFGSDGTKEINRALMEVHGILRAQQRTLNTVKCEKVE